MTATCWEETLLFRALSQLHLVCPMFPLSFLFYEVIHQVLRASRNQCKCVYMCHSLSLIPSIMKGRCIITSYFYTNQEVFWNLLSNLHASEVLLIILDHDLCLVCVTCEGFCKWHWTLLVFLHTAKMPSSSLSVLSTWILGFVMIFVLKGGKTPPLRTFFAMFLQ